MSPAHCDGELTTCPGCACEQSVLPRDLSGPKEEGQSVLLQGEQPQLLLISAPPPTRPSSGFPSPAGTPLSACRFICGAGVLALARSG